MFWEWQILYGNDVGIYLLQAHSSGGGSQERESLLREEGFEEGKLTKETSLLERWPGQEKIIFFLGAQPGDKNFLETNGVFLC
jgi:hypothetical protein